MILHAIGWALIHGLWQAGLVALLVRLALLVTRAPRLRFALAWSGLVVIALSFVATLQVELARARALAGLAAELERPPSAIVGFERTLPWLVLAWALGVAVFGLRAALGFVGVARLRRHARALDGRVAELCETIAAKLGLDQTIAIAESEALEVPAVIGWLRPLILLPVGLASSLDPVALEAAIAHELAHVRRNDYLLNAIASVIEALFFHHPAVWWLAGVARREREHACDDLVVAHVQARHRYARSLFLLEQLRASASAPALSLGADGAPLLDRIRRLQTQATTMPTAKHRFTRLPSWAPLLAFAGALGLAAALPACIDARDELSSVEDQIAGPIEGTIAIGDPNAALDIAWLPDSVRRHAASIEAAARRSGVDPNLLAIIVLLESKGNPDAESPTGARGLMQLMPQTAALVLAREHDDAQHIDVHGEVLSDPELNLQIGATYLSWQLERWGDVELAAAAYNGGPKAVEQWLAGEAALSEETERYRSRVAQLWASRHSDSNADDATK